MKPIGLTMKKSRNRYRLESRGELMLIHQCVECEELSINRIAADDDPESILSVFKESLLRDDQVRALCEIQGIEMLGTEAGELIYQQLYGQNIERPIVI